MSATENQWEESIVPQWPRARWVKVTLHIRKNETGEVRTIKEDFIIEPGEQYPSPYIVEEGNYSCDCNRELYFERAEGNEPELESTSCSDGRFSVNLENHVTGEIFYREFTQP